MIFFQQIHEIRYRTRAIKGRADYSKIIFWEFGAASNQERLQFKKYFMDLFLPQPFLNLISCTLRIMTFKYILSLSLFY